MEGNITVWCLLGKKAGDNTQVLALAQELGFDYVEKQVLARPWELLAHIGSGITLLGIDRPGSSELRPPWPDLVISAGRRNEPVARWIKQQSGGKTRLVHMGRPWAPLSAWDLIITTPQYFLPRQDNILHNALPLHRVPEQELARASADLRETLVDIPRPWIAVFLGGDSGRFVLTPGKGERLGRLANQLAVASGGSLLLTDSPRTPRAAGDALESALTVPYRYHRWGVDTDNPYRGLLGLADAFVVTGESMSMLGEAAATNQTVLIFDVGDGGSNWWSLPHSYRYKPLSHRFAMRFGPQRMRRDVGRIQDALVASGQASWLEEDTIEEVARRLREPARVGEQAVASDELQRAALAVRRLLTAR